MSRRFCGVVLAVALLRQLGSTFAPSKTSLPFMTRTTLLQLLAQPVALSGADVRELEQLAQAFPYCQTAHLLLAKAAHDHGSMLAGQRLRRAATYATDRTRLRQLLELAPTPSEPAEPALAEALAAPTLAEVALAAPDLLLVPAPAAEPAVPPSTALPVEVQAPLEEATENEVVLPPASQAAAAPETELPAQAPLIRPPAEAAAASLEFGLAHAEPAEIMAYRLAVPALDPAATPAAAPLPVYVGVADVGYAPGEGSRLGFCLQRSLEAYSLATGPAALMPSAALPLASEFFAPDALLLAHLAAHQEPAAPALAAQDLINSFLRRKPQATPRRRALPPPPDAEADEQPDLSVPSTRAVPDLASENLAIILVRQGKPDRAIAIYERLMVKHPEKVAYFAARIDSLRPSA